MKCLSPGFTLIELSVVLIIIGFLAAGILMGRDMINSSYIRAQLTQMEKYQTAVSVFRERYGALPGDINAATASDFGFLPRGTVPGEGDGNGILEGAGSVSAGNGYNQAMGELLAFWSDLTYANGRNLNLIDGNFTVSGWTNLNTATTATTSSITSWLPKAKIGANDYIYVWSENRTNYFGIAGVSGIGGGCAAMCSAKDLSVHNAQAIDQKMDDGLPQSGNVIARYVNATPSWVGTSDTSATARSVSTCYDNANVAAGVQQYSMVQNSGQGLNCALSIAFQK